MNTYIKSKYLLRMLVICIAVTLISSCSDFLDEKPISQVSDETFWKNETDANSGISGCYTQLRKALNSGLAYYSYGDLPTDEFTTERDLRSEHNVIQEVDWGVAVGATDSWKPLYKLRNFGLFYATIQQANLCIKHIPTIPENEYKDYSRFKQFMGEAYFIRAFSYFYMARVWGDVPIVDDSNPDLVDLKNYTREDQAKVLAYAIADCETALTYLGWEYSNADERVVRANAGAAWSLLAHIYAWQGNYEACETATTNITTKGFYSYVNRNSYLTLFEGQSVESIFEIAQSKETEASAAFGGNLASFLLRDKYLTTVTKENGWPLDTLTLRQTLFNDPKDLRRINGFFEFNSAFPVLLKYSKIVYTSKTSPLCMNNIVVFRLADIALLQAEAQAAQGKNSLARTNLDMIRKLASLGKTTATDDELFEAIITERGRELYMEGHRFYDLVRLARVKGIYKFGSDNSNKIKEADFKEGKYYWPIQPSLIETNPLIVQTKFWQSQMQ